MKKMTKKTRRIRMKRTMLIMLLVIVMVTGTLFGAGKTEEAKSDVVTLNLRMGVYSPVNLIKEFEKENPNIKINWIQMPSNSDAVHDALVTMLSAGDRTTDIYSVDVVWPAEFGSAGWALPLNQYLTAKEKAEWLQGPYNSGVFQGETWALPLFTDGGMLYYRKDLLDKYGYDPPTTWTELVNIAKDIQSKERDMIGFSWQGARYEGLVCNVLEYIWGNGADVLDAKGNVIIDTPNAAEAIQFMADLVNKEKITPEGVANWTEEESLKVFLDGRAVFMRNWPYAWQESQKSDIVKGKVGVVPMPRGFSGDSGAATLGGWSLMIAANTRYPEEAVKFIKFATSTDVGQKAIMYENGVIPTVDRLYHDPEVIAKYPYYEDFYDVFLTTHPRPVSAYYAELSDAIQFNVHNVLLGRTTAKEMLPKLQAELEKILSR
jgi:multiple sugar transport system substrate-binding protein